MTYRRNGGGYEDMASLNKQKLKGILILSYLASPVEYRATLAIWEPLPKAYGGRGFEDRKAMDRGTDLVNILN